MERYVVATRLKRGAAPAAEELLSAGPPFDPGEARLSAHAAYISNDYVFLVFEGETAHATALQLAKEHVIEVSRWQDIVWELPSVIADVPSGRSLSLPLASRSVGITCVLTGVSVPGPSSRVSSPTRKRSEPARHRPTCSGSWLCSGTTLFRSSSITPSVMLGFQAGELKPERT